MMPNAVNQSHSHRSVHHIPTQAEAGLWQMLTYLNHDDDTHAGSKTAVSIGVWEVTCCREQV